MLKKIIETSDPTNDGREAIEYSLPYTVTLTIEGSADLIFHRWSVESVDGKARAAKGSKAKKTDDIQSYVYRNDNEAICLPGEYLRMSIINAAKYRQDPRSPRKSAMDMFKAAIVPLTILAPVFAAHDKKTPAKAWDYLDTRRVTVQRNGINRSRPAFKAGWSASFQFMCGLPEYVPPQVLHETIEQAGRLIGVADFRPTYGRFQITNFEVQSNDFGGVRLGRDRHG